MKKFSLDYSLDEDYCIDKIQFNKISRPPMDWQDEILNTAEFIKNNTSKDIVVASSGGIDSELICLAFLKKKIPFTVLTVRYLYDTNKHDVQYAIDFCNRHGIKQEFIDLNHFDFFTGGIENYINQGYKAHNLYRYLQMFLIDHMDQMDCTAVIGSGEQRYSFLNGVCGLEFDTDLISVARFSQDAKNVHFPFFNLTTPELVLSYLKDPIVSAFVDSPQYSKRVSKSHNNISLASFYLKQIVYYSYFGELVERPKYNGFENIVPLRVGQQRALQIRFPKLSKNVFLAAPDIISQLEGVDKK